MVINLIMYYLIKQHVSFKLCLFAVLFGICLDCSSVYPFGLIWLISRFVLIMYVPVHMISKHEVCILASFHMFYISHLEVAACLSIVHL